MTGYYFGNLGMTSLLAIAVVVYFIIMTQMFYPITLAMIASTTAQDPVFNTEPTLLVYSQSYVAIGLFIFI